MLSIQHHSTFYQKWSRAFFQRTPPEDPRHPATLSAVQKKIKHDWFYCHVLAVSSFTASPFRSGVSFIPLRFILYTILHYISPSFISLTSAPHSKSNSITSFRKSITQAFRVMAFALPLLQWLLCLYNLQKPPTLQSKMLMPLQATLAVCSIPFSHCICSLPTARLKAVCFIFSAKCLPQPTHERKIIFDWIIQAVKYNR